MKSHVSIRSFRRAVVRRLPACIAIACALSASMSALADDFAGPILPNSESDRSPSRQPIYVSQLPVDAERELDNCKPFAYEPLNSLTIDTAPSDRPGRIKLTSERPKDCASYALGEPPTYLFAPSPDAAGWRYPFMGWRFCHRPLYFEERCLERYGYRSCCCQPFASGVHFYSTALLLPVKLWRQPQCSTCVRTPCY